MANIIGGTLQKMIHWSFVLQKGQELDRKVRTYLFANCIPFNTTRSPYFRKVNSTLENNNLAGDVPPSFEKIKNYHPPIKEKMYR